MSDSESEEEISDLSSPDVTTKYRTASDICNKALQKVVEACVEDADIATLCELGDKIITEETDKIYNKKDKNGRKIEKGVAFPTCISVNEICGHFSPMKGESSKLKAGDVAKVDLAVHIDGFIAAAANTVLVGTEKVEDKRADVIMAAWNAAEAAMRLVAVGKKNTPVTEAWAKIAEEYNCKPLQGVLSHQMKKHVIDGNRVIINCETQDEKVDEFEFEPNEVYCIDCVMTTGEGKAKETEFKNTVFKRNVESNYNLKTQKARQFMSEVNRRFPALPFTLRAIEDELVARVGVSEARRHDLLDEYPVLKEKDREFVAQFKFTVLLLPGGQKKVTGLPLGTLEQLAASSCSIKDAELQALLKAPPVTGKKKRNKKAKDGEKDEKDEKAEGGDDGKKDG